MVGHQYPGMEDQLVFSDRPGQELNEPASVPIIAHDILTLVSAGGDVIQRIRMFIPGRASLNQLYPNAPIYQIKT